MSRHPLFARLSHAWKALRGSGGVAVPHDGRNGDGTYWRLLAPGSQYDYEMQAGDLWRNSAVAACLRVLRTNFPEPKLEVASGGEGAETVAEGHELPARVARPNAHYDRFALWAATTLSLAVDGNAYWLKERARSGKLAGLWWAPTWAVRPVWPPDGSTFIGAYRYEINGRFRYYDPSDVVHFRLGLDPRDDRLGLSDLKAAIREVCTDNDAAGYVAAILRNMGVPTVVITPSEAGGAFQPGQPDDIRAEWRRKTTGENRGDPLVTDTLRVEKLSFTPKEMALGDLPDRIEDRICALTGVPAMLAGLTAGAQHKTYANFAEARRAFYEDTLIPLQKAVAEALTAQLLPDFLAPPGAFVRWNYRGVQCLRENENDLANRVGVLYRDKELIKRGEGRAMLSLPVAPEDDVYYGETVAARRPASDAAAPGAGAGAGEDDTPDGATKALDTPDAAALRLLADAAASLGIAKDFRAGSLTPEQRRSLCHAVGEVAAHRLREMAEDLAADLTHDDGTKMARLLAERVKSFFASSLKTIRTAALAATIGLRGPEELAADDRSHLAAAVAEQEGYLDKFKAAVLDGSQPPDGTLASRAEMYGRASWAIAHKVERAAMAKAGKAEIMNQLGPTEESCPGCVAETAKGWMPIGDIVPIGARDCRVNCRCSYLYR